MKPKSIRAAIQMMLPEVEEMLSLGISREDVFNAVSVRFHFGSINIRSFDTALYRARRKKKNHSSDQKKSLNTHKPDMDVAKNSQDSGIIGKAFFDEIKDTFDPTEFVDKY